VGQWIVRLWIAAVLVMVLIGLDRRMPLIPSACEQYYKHYNERDQPAYNDCAAFHRFITAPVADALVWVGDAIEDHHDAIIALGTLVIAGFTGTLWWVTWGMIGIAEQQRTEMGLQRAEMAMQRTLTEAVERAWIKAEVFIGAPIIFTETGASITLEYRVKNIGRLPARVKTPVAIFSPLGTEWVNSRGPTHDPGDYLDPSTDFGSIVFPGQTDRLAATYPVDAKTIQSTNPGAPPYRDRVILSADCFVQYTYPGARTVHTTPLHINISMNREGEHAGMWPIPVIPGPVPVVDLRITGRYGISHLT
jgi:hypothetical protein